MALPPAVPLETQALRWPIVLLLAMVLLAISLNITNSRMPDPSTEKELPDLGFDVLPQISSLEHVTDALLWTLNVLCLGMMIKLQGLHRAACGLPDIQLPLFPSSLCRFLFSASEPRTTAATSGISVKNVHFIAWIRFWVTFAILSGFRAIVIVATTLPATTNQCQHPQTITDPLLNIVLAIVTFGSGNIHCGDLLYSGHTVSVTLAFMSIWTYGPLLTSWLRPVAFSLMASSWVTIIASRSHYTDDVLIALYLTTATYLLIPHSEYGAPETMHFLVRWPYLGCGGQQQDASESSTLGSAEVDLADSPA